MSSLPNAAGQMETFGFAALSEAQNYRDAVLKEFSEYLRGSVLEVGAGVGHYTGALLRNPAISYLTSLEPDPRFHSRLQATFPGHHAVQGSIADVKDPRPWDVILNINVLEHIADDETELSTYRRRLEPARGVLCLFTPARPEIYSPMDKEFGHFRRYTRRELLGKLERAGFEILRLQYYNLVGYFGWWFNFCLLRKKKFELGWVRFFDRVIFPIVHGVESRVGSPPFGQSLLAVARPKPSP
jgi:SAM-dependent methyltransferase